MRLYGLWRGDAARKPLLLPSARQVNQNDGSRLYLRPLFARKAEPLLPGQVADVLSYCVFNAENRFELGVTVPAVEDAAQRGCCDSGFLRDVPVVLAGSVDRAPETFAPVG